MKNVVMGKFKWVLVTISILLLGIMVLSLGLTLGKMNTTTKLGSSGFKVGNIEMSTGKVVESNQHLYTKMLKCGRMEITLKDNATITYDVYFYDKDGKFLSVINDQSSDFSTSYDNAEYFRVVITPALKDEEPVKIGIFNKLKYTSQIEIIYTR